MAINTELLEKLIEAKNNENAIKYMKGYALTDGRQVAQYEVTLIDIDTATACYTVFSEFNGETKVETLNRNQILFRTA